MKRIYKGLVSLILVISILVGSTISVSAVDGEKYISEIRIIYADTYDDAKAILEDSIFSDYELLNSNLNSGTGEEGVFLAYKVTEEIEDAITDLAVIEMDGGYREGNYQAMLEQSYNEYVVMGQNYLDAIDYFVEAYNAGDFPAEAAYRQLNFYTVIDEEVSFDGMLLGDIFAEGITSLELATMFMEGNSYALNNIRSLISMGVTYNEEGKTYLERVEEEAIKYAENPDIYYDYEVEYDEMAVYVTSAIQTFYDMFDELSTYESQLNYEDDILTELEKQYAESKSIADMLRAVKYQGSATLYDFCMSEGQKEEIENSAIYPLIAALNPGQLSMTKVGHYYDVVRYSLKDYPEELINTQIETQEEIYSVAPFDIYTGVDRSIYDGTFALTSEAYRADASNEEGLAAYLFNQDNVVLTSLAIASGAVGIGLSVWGICRASKTITSNMAAQKSIKAAENVWAARYATADSNFASADFYQFLNLRDTPYLATNQDAVDALMNAYYPGGAAKLTTCSSKLSLLSHKTKVMYNDNFDHYVIYERLCKDYQDTMISAVDDAQKGLEQAKQTTIYGMSKNSLAVTGALQIIGGALILFNALTLAISIDDYYHPEYTEIPVALVDLIDTDFGDRYIKYDVVSDINMYGNHAPADLNAFSAHRWNALYYTKSYEAGKPLLADFTVSNDNNTPESGYAPVRHFGEIICYDLNKYNFDSDADNIYLSVKQSENQKAAVADVPELVGSVFSQGYVFLYGGIGLLAGILVTIASQNIYRKNKKANKETKEEA